MSISKRVKIGVAVVAVIVLAAGGAWYWENASKVRSTDNAYVNADIVQVASQATGPVAKVYVREGQLVKAGERLFDIDPAPFRVALQEAQAKLSEAEQGVRQDLTDVNANQAALAQADADLHNTENAAARARSLTQRNFLSKQAEDDAQVKVALAEAAVRQARAKLAGAQAHVKSVGGATPAVLAARAAVEQAELDLAHTQVVASKDGWIANITLVAGTTVSANTPLFALIAQGSFRVDANFKETELPGIKVGQPAEVEVDMLPGHVYHAVVEAIGNGTGAAFSLLPAQNATGNWVKVTQRVPVRVRFVGDDARQVFRVGASAQVGVRVKG